MPWRTVSAACADARRMHGSVAAAANPSDDCPNARRVSLRFVMDPSLQHDRRSWIDHVEQPLGRDRDAPDATAFATAGATATMPGSPTPLAPNGPVGSASSTMIGSIAGGTSGAPRI